MRSPLQQLTFNTQIPLLCETVLIFYKPLYAITNHFAHSVEELDRIIQDVQTKAKFIVVCSDQLRAKLDQEIDEYLQRREASHKMVEYLDDQLIEGIEGIEDSQEIERGRLSQMLKGIVERTENKIRERKIKAKMSKIDMQIMHFEEIQTKSKAKNIVDHMIEVPKVSQFSASKKSRKREKAIDKKLEELKCRREILESSKKGVKTPSTIEQLLRSSSQSSSVSDLI